MNTDDHVSVSDNSFAHLLDQVRVFHRRRVADGVRHVEHWSARINGGVKHFAKVIDIAARRVFGWKLDIFGVVACLFDGGARHFNHFRARLFEFVFEMDVGRGAERVNARMSRIMQSLRGAGDVLFRGATERGNLNCLALSRDGPDGGKVAFRSYRKAGLNDVDAEILELIGHPDLLGQVHWATRRLLAVT